MSCTTLSNRLVQIKAKIQAVNDGCEWDAPVDADLIVGIQQGKVNTLETENVDPEIVKATLSNEAPQAGIRWGVIDCSFRLIGAGDYSTGDAINVHPLIIGNGNQVAAMQSIPVSAIATPYVKGEIVTGGTSTFFGTVAKDTESTDAFILVTGATGAFQAEALTGSIAGAATATGADTLGGNQYSALSTDHQKLSIEFDEFGNMRTQMYNSVFVGSVSVDDSNFATYTGQIIGPLRVVAEVEQYRRDAVFVNLSQALPVKPALYKNARYKIGSFVPVISGSTTFDTAIEAPQRRNANSETGLEGMFIGARVPVHGVRFELVPNSQYDIYLDRLNINESIIQYYLGSAVGNTCYWHYPKATPIASADEDQDNIAMVSASYSLVGDNDDEFTWLTY
jgi:hypothetical protein